MFTDWLVIFIRNMPPNVAMNEIHHMKYIDSVELFQLKITG